MDQVGVDNYIQWIELVAQFTINSLKSWQWASGSVYYLLGLWSRLVSSTPYLKGGVDPSYSAALWRAISAPLLRASC